MAQELFQCRQLRLQLPAVFRQPSIGTEFVLIACGCPESLLLTSLAVVQAPVVFWI